LFYSLRVLLDVAWGPVNGLGPVEEGIHVPLDDVVNEEPGHVGVVRVLEFERDGKIN